MYGKSEKKEEEEGGAAEKRKGKGRKKGTEQSRKLLLPRRATISLRASNFYDEATRAGRSSTQGDEVLSTCNAAIFVFFSRKVTR